MAKRVPVRSTVHGESWLHNTGSVPERANADLGVMGIMAIVGPTLAGFYQPKLLNPMNHAVVRASTW